MILERAELVAKPGTETALRQFLQDPGIALLSAAEGCHWVKVGRGVENPDKFILLVAWESVEAHKAFIGPSGKSPFGLLLAPFGASGSAEHFDIGEG